MKPEQIKKLVQDNGDFYAALVDSAIHTKRNCNIVVSVDNNGIIKKVRIEETIYHA